jgi:sigma-B regulation protein RsbU (phosphoserine phosphatase)
VSRVTLRQVFGGTAGTRDVLGTFGETLGIRYAVEDREGRLLFGGAEPASSRFPVTWHGLEIGWVLGPEPARAVVPLLEHLLAREVERKALGTEVLHLYREVNLIYSFSEKLAALLDLERVAQLTLQQARHLIVATDGVILLLDEDSGALSTVAGFGDELPGLTGVRLGHGVIGTVAATGIAEVVHDVLADHRRIVQDPAIRSLICAPLKVGERVTGVIALASSQPIEYTAAELKLLNTLALQTATAIENARLFQRTIQEAVERERLRALHQEAELARAGLERELELAARIQAALFPASLPDLDGYDLAARNQPARQCGGDYYDALVASAAAGRVLLCVADVSGKGLPASLLMSSLQATLRALATRTESLGALTARMSELLYLSTGDNKYATAALLDLDTATGAAHYVSAGHTDSLLIRADGSAEHLHSTGVPLGLLPPGLPFEETTVSLAPGDVLVLYTDGVSEAQNAAGDEFGDARLADIVRRSSGESSGTIVTRIFDAIDAHAGETPQFDDITLMVLRRLDAHTP